MNRTKLDCSINDTAILRNLILENPELPLLIFCGEDAHNDEFSYSQAEVKSMEVEKLTLYKQCWLTEEDYEETLFQDLADEVKYKDLQDEDYDKMIERKVAETEFVKAIVIWVG